MFCCLVLLEAALLVAALLLIERIDQLVRSHLPSTSLAVQHTELTAEQLLRATEGPVPGDDEEEQQAASGERGVLDGGSRVEQATSDEHGGVGDGERLPDDDGAGGRSRKLNKAGNTPRQMTEEKLDFGTADETRTFEQSEEECGRAADTWSEDTTATTDTWYGGATAASDEEHSGRRPGWGTLSTRRRWRTFCARARAQSHVSARID